MVRTDTSHSRRLLGPCRIESRPSQVGIPTRSRDIRRSRREAPSASHLPRPGDGSLSGGSVFGLFTGSLPAEARAGAGELARGRIRDMRTREVETPFGTARVHLQGDGGPSAALVLIRNPAPWVHLGRRSVLQFSIPLISDGCKSGRGFCSSPFSWLKCCPSESG